MCLFRMVSACTSNISVKASTSLHACALSAKAFSSIASKEDTSRRKADSASCISSGAAAPGAPRAPQAEDA